MYIFTEITIYTVLFQMRNKIKKNKRHNKMYQQLYHKLGLFESIFFYFKLYSFINFKFRKRETNVNIYVDL